MKKPDDKKAADNRPKKATYTTLVCFAVKSEAEPFEKHPKKHHSVGTLVTGMGEANAEQAVRKSLAKHKPHLVLSCGFGGGLNPYLDRNTVIFSGGDARLESRLLAAGALAGNIHHAGSVITTVKEKQELYESTRADVVDMESKAIRAVCEEEKIMFASVRVVLDAANEDLPFDFNSLMNKQHEISRFKLAKLLISKPKNVVALMAFNKKYVIPSAQALAKVLVGALPV